MSVSAVVVSHGHAAELETLLPLLAPQVDELVVVANVPGSVPEGTDAKVRVLENPRPRRLSENVNLGVAATTGEFVLSSNPDVVPASTPSPRCVTSPRRASGVGSPVRAPSGPTEGGSRRAGTSRRFAARSSAGRHSGASSRRSSCSRRTTT